MLTRGQVPFVVFIIGLMIDPPVGIGLFGDGYLRS